MKGFIPGFTPEMREQREKIRKERKASKWIDNDLMAYYGKINMFNELLEIVKEHHHREYCKDLVRKGVMTEEEYIEKEFGDEF